MSIRSLAERKRHPSTDNASCRLRGCATAVTLHGVFQLRYLACICVGAAPPSLSTILMSACLCVSRQHDRGRVPRPYHPRKYPYIEEIRTALRVLVNADLVLSSYVSIPFRCSFVILLRYQRIHLIQDAPCTLRKCTEYGSYVVFQVRQTVYGGDDRCT